LLLVLFDKVYREKRSSSNSVQRQRHAAEQGVDWIFIATRTPHFGGLWEAAVMVAKLRLVRGVGNVKLTPEELNTYIIENKTLLRAQSLHLATMPRTEKH